MELWKKITLATLVGFVALQAASCKGSNPPVNADLRADPEVKSVLRRACYDCHSNETVWPWYSHVVPVSWLIRRDVLVGREHLNFSEWESLPADKRAKLRRKSREEIAEGEMPPWLYLRMHPAAALSSADRRLLDAWTRGEQEPRVTGAHGGRERSRSANGGSAPNEAARARIVGPTRGERAP